MACVCNWCPQQGLLGQLLDRKPPQPNALSSGKVEMQLTAEQCGIWWTLLNGLTMLANWMEI